MFGKFLKSVRVVRQIIVNEIFAFLIKNQQIHPKQIEPQ